MDRLMLVDDDPHVLSALKRVLISKDRELETHVDPHEALRRLQTTPFDLVLSDFRMPGMDGVQLLCEAKRLQPEAMRMILSGYADLDAVLSAINQAEIYRFLSKPWQDYELRTTVEQALAFRAAMVENRRLADQVRVQRQQLSLQQQELGRLERLHPGLTRVSWAEDGSVLLDDTGLSHET